MPTKRDSGSGIVVGSLPLQRSPAELSAQDAPQPVDDASRRKFLRRTGTLAGGALATGVSLTRRRRHHPRLTWGSASRFPRTTMACPRSSSRTCAGAEPMY